jgi:N-acetylglucosaminyl-diphospho-decaprenol L-rhamnosyltransferase
MTCADVSVIIVNYRSAAFTRACLHSISLSSAADCEVIVVDNASYDGCGEMLRVEFPRAVFLQSAVNLGFAGANNLGAAAAHGEYLLYLNPDTEVEPGAIARLRACLAATPDAGLAGARRLNSDLSLQNTCVTAFPTIGNQVLGADYLQRRFPAARLWGMRALYSGQRTPSVVDAVSGACVMAKRAMMERVQGFSTDYFMYGEDLDLCLKVRQAGWKVYHVPEALVVHHGGCSSGSRPESNFAAIMIRESLYQFMSISRGGWYARAFRAASTVLATCRVIALTPLLPLAVRPFARRGVFRSWKKWAGILAWSLGLATWTRREQAARPVLAEPLRASRAEKSA